MSISTDHYAALGCEKTASYDQLKEAYFSLVMEHHPDKNEYSTSHNHETFQRIDKAWKTLRDPKSRAAYDEEIKQNEIDKTSLIYGTFTLKDLSYDQGEQVYYCPCRCGGQYVFSKTDSEEFHSYLINCDTCSLVILVSVNNT